MDAYRASYFGFGREGEAGEEAMLLAKGVNVGVVEADAEPLCIGIGDAWFCAWRWIGSVLMLKWIENGLSF